MKEIWKDIHGYEQRYQVSNIGRIKSLKRVCKRGNNHKPVNECILKPGNNKGYMTVALSKNGNVKYFQVHRLVAEAFIPNPDNLPCVNHKDENSLNNNVDNLEWCTYSYNNSYNELARKKGVLKRIPVLQFSKTGQFIREWDCAGTVEQELGISHHSIYGCCKGKTKTSGGFIWKRKNSMK